MSELLVGFDMPPDRAVFLAIDNGVVYAKTLQMKDWKRLENVSVHHVPQHGRLIDADALMKTCGMATDCYDCPNGEHGWCKRSQDAANICEAIEDAQTIIPADKEKTCTKK